MDEAQAHGLGVMLRVGYTWDYYSSESVLERYEKLMYEETVQNAWLEYVERLYVRASAHENFCGGFLTWEDFWNFTDNAASMGEDENGIVMAEICGYRDYAQRTYSLEEPVSYTHLVRMCQALDF